MLNHHIETSFFSSIFKSCKKGWNLQCSIVICVAIIAIFKSIWHCKNSQRFEYKTISINYCIASTTVAASLTGNITRLTMGPSIADFSILKNFKINIHHPKAIVIKEVLWTPSNGNCVKCNTDGSSIGSFGLAACGGLFRPASGDFIGGIATNRGFQNSLYDELMGIILAIELASTRGCKSLWIETNSRLATLAFKNTNIIPWEVSNRCNNCLCKIRSINFVITHIYIYGRESLC